MRGVGEASLADEQREQAPALHTARGGWAVRCQASAPGVVRRGGLRPYNTGNIWAARRQAPAPGIRRGGFPTKTPLLGRRLDGAEIEKHDFTVRLALEDRR